jgi:hypothetical protein
VGSRIRDILGSESGSFPNRRSCGPHPLPLRLFCVDPPLVFPSPSPPSAGFPPLKLTLAFSSRLAKGGFKSGERWEVVRAELGAAVVVAKAGEEKLLPLDQANTFDFYVTEQISLAAGDAVRITKNFRAGGFKFGNNELCTVKAIDGEKITLSDDRVIDSQKALHLNQGIAVTSHASQGKTVDQVIVSAPVPAFSQVNSAQFYVSMSRARHAMHLFTDSIAALREGCLPAK